MPLLISMNASRIYTSFQINHRSITDQTQINQSQINHGSINHRSITDQSITDQSQINHRSNTDQSITDQSRINQSQINHGSITDQSHVRHTSFLRPQRMQRTTPMPQNAHTISHTYTQHNAHGAKRELSVVHTTQPRANRNHKITRKPRTAATHAALVVLTPKCARN